MSNLKKGLADFKSGKFLIVTDDENRENEGDLIVLANQATTEKIAFMVRYTSGVICAALTNEIAQKLKLPLMVKNNQDSHLTAFTISVDLNNGRSTGINAQERANTLRGLADPTSRAADFSRPGHIFPLIAVDGGLHQRRGHTEAGVALCHLVDSYPVAVICELVNDDGSMMRGEQLRNFAQQFEIEMISIAQIANQIGPEIPPPPLTFEWAKMPTKSSEWQITSFTSATGAEHAIFKYGEVDEKSPAGILTRIHSECLTGDTFGSLRCDCGAQLNDAIDAIVENGSGLIIYLRDHEGRGIGFSEKVRAYKLQDLGQNTVEANLNLGHLADERSYHDAIKIIGYLGINKITLLSNNPAKAIAFENSEIEIIVKPMKLNLNQHNKKYLKSKRDLLAHTLGDI